MRNESTWSLSTKRKNREQFPSNCECNLQFALAVLYADNGQFQKYRDTLPDEILSEANASGELDAKYAFVMAMVLVNRSISTGKDLESVATNAQKIVNGAQRASMEFQVDDILKRLNCSPKSSLLSRNSATLLDC